MTVPPLVVNLLVEFLRQIASGNALGILPVRKEVTTQEAAELLNVSRPFVISLLQKGEIPFRMVGSHRRIPLTPLLAYKHKTDAARDKALDFLAAQAQELKLRYYNIIVPLHRDPPHRMGPTSRAAHPAHAQR